MVASAQRLVLGALGVCLLLPCSFASAQQEPPVAYLDGERVWRIVDPSDWRPLPERRLKAIGSFNVIFRDVEDRTGFGFDDPAEGATRRATVTAVFEYISSVINVPGVADIEFQRSQTDGGGFLAAAGSLVSIDGDGFKGGFTFDHLTTGVDPSSSAPDGNVTMDFGWPWNSDMGPTPSNEIDLFSVVLHEVTHALGIASYASSNGTSKIGSFNAGSGIFTRYDDFLQRGSTGKDLYLPGGVINATSNDVRSGDVVFAGPRATAAFGSSPPVHAPSGYSSGSSISHWASGIEPTPVMLASTTGGREEREYHDWEVQALADLGYPLQLPEPDPFCGDGMLDEGEGCDDGNNVPGDGCDAACMIELDPPDDGGTLPDGGVPFDGGAVDGGGPRTGAQGAPAGASTLTGTCSLRSGSSNATLAFLMLFSLCALLRRRR